MDTHTLSVDSEKWYLFLFSPHHKDFISSWKAVLLWSCNFERKGTLWDADPASKFMLRQKVFSWNSFSIKELAQHWNWITETCLSDGPSAGQVLHNWTGLFHLPSTHKVPELSAGHTSSFSLLLKTFKSLWARIDCRQSMTGILGKGIKELRLKGQTIVKIAALL